MMTQKQISDLFARKVPLAKCEQMIDELLEIALNHPKNLPVRNKFGTVLRDEDGEAVYEDQKEHSTTNQIAAIRTLTEYAIGKPGSGETEDETNKGGGVVVILPNNNR